MNTIQAPKGTRDIFTPEVEKWQYLETMIRSYFSRFLFREVRTPVFEYSELFTRGIGEATQVVQKEMYTFPDRSESRSLTLRPENTASVMRCLIEHNLFDVVAPLKFYYIGPMFRAERPQKGRYRQFHQFGAEIIGDDTPQTDAEVVYSAFDFLSRVGIGDKTLHLNSVGCSQCRPDFLRELQATARREQETLCEDCRKKVDANPLRIFDCKRESCILISERFPRITDHLCPGCADHFQRVRHSLELISVPFQINSRLVRGLDYYTKTTFEITSGSLGSQNALLGGGRYNDLIRELGGPDLPGIGFAAGMERVLMSITDFPAPREDPLFVIYHNETLLDQAFQLLHQLWEQGFPAVMEYQPKNIKKQFKRADRLQARFALILGEEEIASGQVSVKDMRAQQQVSIPRKELFSWLKSRN